MNKRWLTPLVVMLVALIPTVIVAQKDRSVPSLDFENGTFDFQSEDAIRAAVTKYFEWQYSVEKDGLALSSYLEPSATTAASQTFFRQKRDVLEVIEYSTQLNGVKIADQSFSLNIYSVSLSARNDLATVELSESYQRQYEYASDPGVGAGIIHKIKLQRNNGEWEVTDDTVLNATDTPPMVMDKEAVMQDILREAGARRASEQQMLVSAGVTTDFLSKERERLGGQGLDQRQIEEHMALVVNDKMRVTIDASESNRNTNRNYNRNSAKSYIDRWWNGRNSAWGNFDSLGGDCTNWISQIISAGGVPEDKTGSYQWYWDNMGAPRTSPPYTRSASWAGVNELWSYIQGNSSNNGPLGPQGQLWTNSAGHTQMLTGDIIQLRNNGGGTWFHTYGVHHAQWVNLKPWYCPWCADDWRYKVYVTSHYANRWQDDLDQVAASSPTRRYVNVMGWYQP
jgi:hypothetical protein